MIQLRKLQPIDPKMMHQCDGLDICRYEMEEVILPLLHGKTNVKAIRVVVYGRNLIAGAQPLSVKIGEHYLKFLRIAPDERSVEGILLADPKPKSKLRVQLGDQDSVEFYQEIDTKKIRRLGASDT